MNFDTLFSKFSNSIVQLLPASPFAPALEYFNDLPYLGWLNWVIPVKDMLRVAEVWLAAITVFYLYSIIMRWLKLIGD